MALDRTVSVKLKAEIGGYVAGIRQAGAETASFAKNIEKGAVKNRDHLNKLGGALAVVGTVAATGVLLAVKAFADFDKAMSGVEAATHESAAGMQALRDAAIEAGAKTAFSANEAAAAEEALAKAGVSTADILGGGLSGALDLAAAGSLGVAEAAEIAATAMTQFGLAGSDIPHVADLLAAGAGKAQGEVADLGLALKYVGPVAHSMGVSIDETVGVIAELASQGILADQAGTSLRAMMLGLAAPSAQAAKAMKGLGVDVFDSQGKFVGMEVAAGKLQAGMAGLTDKQKTASTAIIFGREAASAATIVINGGAEAVKKWTDRVNDQGFAAETAALKMNNLSGDIEKLRGSLSSLLIEGGEGSNGLLRPLVQSIEDVVNALGKLSPETQKTILGTLSLVAALALLGAGGLKAVTAFGTLKVALAAVGKESLLTASSLGKIALAGGGIIAAAVAADSLYAALGRASAGSVDIDRLADSMTDAGESFDAATTLSAEGIKLFGANSRSFGRDARTSDEALRALVDTMAAAGGSGLGDKFDRLFDNAAMPKLTKETQQMDVALTDLVESGNGDVAAQQFHLITQAALEAHLPLDKLNQLFPEYTKAVGSGAKSAKELAGELQAATVVAYAALPPVAELTTEQQGAAKAADQHAKALDALIENLHLLKGEAIDVAESQFDFQDALVELNKTVRENGQSLSENTVKGRANQRALIDLIESANTHAEALGKQKNGADAASASFDKDVAALRRQAIATGLSKAEVDKLIATYARVPPVKETKIDTPGLDSAIAKSKGFLDYLKALPASKRTLISAPGADGAAAKVKALRDYIKELHDKAITITTHYMHSGSVDSGLSDGDTASKHKSASGGYITGPGSGTSDSIPYWLSNGEYVINAAATSANRSLLDAINRGGLTSGATTTRQPNGYADGGPVRSSGATLTLEQHVTVANLDELNRKTQNTMRDVITMANLRGI